MVEEDYLRLGITAYNQGEYELAFHHMSIAAEQENPRAQFNLGLLYQYGLGVEKSYELASKWFTLAAIQGHERSIEALQQIIHNRDSKLYCFCAGIDIESTVIHTHQD